MTIDATPLIGGLIILLVLVAVFSSSGGGSYGRCPHCKERVRKDASLCPHCRSAIEPGAVLAGPESEGLGNTLKRKRGSLIVLGAIVAAIVVVIVVMSVR